MFSLYNTKGHKQEQRIWLNTLAPGLPPCAIPRALPPTILLPCPCPSCSPWLTAYLPVSNLFFPAFHLILALWFPLELDSDLIQSSWHRACRHSVLPALLHMTGKTSAIPISWLLPPPAPSRILRMYKQSVMQLITAGIVLSCWFFSLWSVWYSIRSNFYLKMTNRKNFLQAQKHRPALHVNTWQAILIDAKCSLPNLDKHSKLNGSEFNNFASCKE